jgi:hypothetical protein
MENKDFLLRPFSLEGLETLELRPERDALPKTPQRFDVLLSLDTHANWNIETLLSNARELLKFDGALLLLIENPFSLSNWNGTAKEGKVFQDLCQPTSPFSTTPEKLQSSLKRFDLRIAEELYVFPSTAGAQLILEADLLKSAPTLVAEMAGQIASEESRLFPSLLASHRLVEHGLFAHFVPAKLLVITFAECEHGVEKILRDSNLRGEVAWYRPKERRIPTETIVVQDSRGIAFHKKTLETNPEKLRLFSDKGFALTWKGDYRAPWIPEKKFLDIWYQTGYCKAASDCFDLLEHFLANSFERHRADNPSQLDGSGIDALCTNAAAELSQNGLPVSYKIFDHEWKLEDPFSKSWFILRNLLVLSRHQAVLLPVPQNFVEDWYRELCKNLGVKGNLERDLEYEGAFQELATLNPVHYSNPRELLSVLAPKTPPVAYPRESLFGSRDEKIADLQDQMGRRRYRIADLLASLWKSLFTPTSVRDRSTYPSYRSNP